MSSASTATIAIFAHGYAITIDPLAVVGVFRRHPLQVDRQFGNLNVIR